MSDARFSGPRARCEAGEHLVVHYSDGMEQCVHCGVVLAPRRPAADAVREVPEQRIKQLSARVAVDPESDRHLPSDSRDEWLMERAGFELARQLMAYRKVLVARDASDPTTVVYRFAVEVIVPETPPGRFGPGERSS